MEERLEHLLYEQPSVSLVEPAAGLFYAQHSFRVKFVFGWSLGGSSCARVCSFRVHPRNVARTLALMHSYTIPWPSASHEFEAVCAVITREHCWNVSSCPRLLVRNFGKPAARVISARGPDVPVSFRAPAFRGVCITTRLLF